MNASATVPAQESGASAEAKTMNAPRPEVPEGFESFGRRLTRIEARLANIERYGATRADIKALEARIGSWFLGLIVLLLVRIALQIVRL